jgi:hypothetical protein
VARELVAAHHNIDARIFSRDRPEYSFSFPKSNAKADAEVQFHPDVRHISGAVCVGVAHAVIHLHAVYNVAGAYR